MTKEELKEDKAFDSIEQLSKIAQDLVRRKTELSQTEQKPVAWVWVNNKGWLNYGETPHDVFKSSPLYTHPPQRKPLTDEQAMDAYFETPPFGTYKEAFIAGIRFIEAAHGIKGEA